MAQTSLVKLNEYLGLVDPTVPRPLAFLTTKDKQMLLLYLQGISPRDICEQVNASVSRFKRILKSDLGQLVINDYFKFVDQEFSTLYELAVDAIRKGLNDDDMRIRLTAADKFLKAHGKYESRAEAGGTAEDVVRRMLEIKITEERKVGGTKDAGKAIEHIEDVQDAEFS